MSRIDSYLKRSPLKIIVSRKTKLFYADSHGSLVDSHGSHVDSHDSLARWLAYSTHSTLLGVVVSVPRCAHTLAFDRIKTLLGPFARALKLYQ